MTKEQLYIKHLDMMEKTGNGAFLDMCTLDSVLGKDSTKIAKRDRFFDEKELLGVCNAR